MNSFSHLLKLKKTNQTKLDNNMKTQSAHQFYDKTNFDNELNI
jgi:hypothetical protein